MYKPAIRVALFVVCCFPLFSGAAITRTWGGGISNNFSEPNNWSPAGVPAASDALVFPSGSVTLNNDLPAGTSFGPMTFNGSATLSGNPMTLTGNLTFDMPAFPHFTCNADLKIGAPLTLGSGITSSYNDAIDVNGQTLTIESYNTTLQTLNGTGTVIVDGSGVMITASGTFSGTISATIDVAGSMPNANLLPQATNWPGLSGTGTLGNVEVQSISPGTKNPCCADAHSIGTLTTKSLTIGGGGMKYAYFDLNAAGGSDSIHVTGTVTLDSPTLSISLPGAIPTAGQKFTIIDNDGSDAVNGTFSGLPEGGVFDVSGVDFSISYHGGDGNDVVLTVAAVQKTWTGNANSLWSNPANWTPAAIPVAGEPLLFPFNATTTNDLPAGTSVGALRFNQGGTVNGNSMTLTGNVTFDMSTFPHFTCNADLKIGGPVTLGSAIASSYNDAIDVNGQTLTIESYNTTLQTLNGTGTVIVDGSGVMITASGTFNGTILGNLDVAGSMPNANLLHQVTNWAVLSGTGTLGNVEVQSISPGTKNPCCADEHTFGTLTTKSLTISGGGMKYAYFDLNAAGGSDSIHVTGTVTLDSPTLSISLPAAIPTAGQKFTIIDNDGSDAVNGTFSGLPEAGSFDVSGVHFSISYHGGDGNDVVLTVASAQKSWTGTANSLWSNPANWNPAAIPVAGEPLVFPFNATTTNDLPAGTSIGPLRFNQGGTVNGNSMTLIGNLVFDMSTFPHFTCNADLKIGGPVTLGSAIASSYNDAIDVNGQTLTIESYNTTLQTLNGTGTVIVDGSGVMITGSGTFNGTITGDLDIAGAMPDANLLHQGTFWPTLSGTGTLGNVEVSYILPGTKPPCCGDEHTFGTLTTKSLTIAASPTGLPSFAHAYFDLNPAGGSDSIHVTGTVSLVGPTLIITVPSGTPVVGQAFVIIDNDGNDAVHGTFANLPEGAEVQANGYVFRITYAGGDGNDVELVMATTPSAALSQTTDTSLVGEPVALQAVVSSPFGTPAGIVTFVDNGVTIGTAPLSNGTANLNVSTLTLGSHAITAVYLGGGAFFGAVCGPVTHTVSKGDTTTTLQSLHTPALLGAAEFRVLSVPVAPAAGTVAGSLALREGKSVLSGGNIDAGSGHVFLPTLSVGTHTLIATYGGSDTFLGSDSAPFTVEVTEAPTQTQAAKDDSASSAAGTVVLNVFVTPLTSASVTPTGTIVISENGVIWSLEPVAGSLNVSLKLPGGHHALSIGYSGDSNFLGSATELDVDMAAAPPARRRGVHH